MAGPRPRRGDERNGGNHARNLRLHRRRRRLGRLRDRRAAQREPEASRAAARGGPEGFEPVDPHADGLRQALRPSQAQLDVRERARARIAEPHDVPAARQGAGRHQLDQRHGLYARQPGRLRRVAAARLHRLGLGQHPALFQEGRRPGARPQRGARRRRAAARLRASGALEAGRAFCRRRDRGRACRPTTISTAATRTAPGISSAR